MQIEGGKVNKLHLTFLIIGFTFGTSVIFSPAAMAGHDAWLTMLGGLIIGLLFAYIFFTLAEKFPGKNLLEINDLLFGAYLGKTISLFYLGYFLHLGSLVLFDFGQFLTLTIYPLTPIIVLISLSALITASAVRNGIEVITRCSLILVPINVFSYLFNSILLSTQLDLSRLLPIFELSWKDFLRISHANASFPFGETICFLMVTASLNNTKGFKKTVLLGLIFAGTFLIWASARNTAVLGITAKINLYPSYETIQQISASDFLTRLELIIVAFMITMGFLKLAVLYYGTVLGLGQLFKMRSYLPLVLPIGIIMVVLSMTQFGSAQENITWTSNFYQWYSLPLQFLIPLISLILASLKGSKAGKKKAGEAT